MNANSAAARRRRGKNSNSNDAKPKPADVHKEAVLRECGSLTIGRVNQFVSPYESGVPRWYAIYAMPQMANNRANSMLATGATRTAVLHDVWRTCTLGLVDSLFHQLQEMKKEASTPELMAAALFGERQVIDDDELHSDDCVSTVQFNGSG